MTTETEPKIDEKTDEKQGLLEIMARMTNTKIEIRDVVDKFLLITYDMPTTPEGNRARNHFLAEAKMIGATQHTESVYLMPWTPRAELLALQLARAGNAVVWTSATSDAAKAEEITRNYDAGLRPQMREISKRIDKVGAALEKGYTKRAEKLTDKTERMLSALEEAIIRRGSAELFITIMMLKQRLNAMFGRA